MSQRPRGRDVPAIIPIDAALAAETLDVDAAYFDAHPGETEYVRRFVPGEFCDEYGVDHPPPSGMVRVLSIGGPIRARVPAEAVLSPELIAYIAEMRAKPREEQP